MDKLSAFAFCDYEWFLDLYAKAKRLYPDIKLPAHRPHITVIKTTKIKKPILTREKMERLFKMNGRLCGTFEYREEFETNGKHVWVAVQCPRAESLREIFGLSRKPKISFHITIGFLV